MGRIDDSLIDVQGRQPNPVVNAKGNYRRSEFSKAPFVYWDGDDSYDWYAFTPEYITKCLLFMNGTVIKMKPRSIYPAGSLEAYEIDLMETMRLNANVENATTLITTSQNQLAVGEQVSGYTVTNNVQLKGQYTEMVVLNRNAALPPYVVLSASSNSGVKSGPQNYVGIIDEVPVDVQPVLLRQQDYTQAMRTAGDLIVAVQGGVGAVAITWQIVGIWEEVAPV